MPLTTKEFLEKYTRGHSENREQAFSKAMEGRFNLVPLGDDDNTVVLEARGVYRYDEDGVMIPLRDHERTPEYMMNEMLRGAIFVVSRTDEGGYQNLDPVETITATEFEGNYYVSFMDAAKVREACEDRPVAEAPGFLDKLLDFFCRLIGKRNLVCALWEEMPRISLYSESLDKIDAIEAERDKKRFQREMTSGQYVREEKELSNEEQQVRVNKAKDLLQEHTNTTENFNEELTEWYLALYASSHEIFPAFIPEQSEIEMARMDHNALNFAWGKIEYEEQKNTRNAAAYTRKEDLDDQYKRFDVRASTATTLAFAVTADRDMSAEDVFRFLAGENVAGADELNARMNDLMKKVSSPDTRNSEEIHEMIRKGTSRMCTLLESQQDLRSGISYQLGRMIQRNLFTFDAGYTMTDISVKLEISPMAKQISDIQNEIIDSYTPNVLQGFALHKGRIGEKLTMVAAPVMLPQNAVGHTSAAFLDKLTSEPIEKRQQFLKRNLPLLKGMNDNLKNFVAERADDENCPWMETPETLKKALNGGMVKEYHEFVEKYVQNQKKLPEFTKELDPYHDLGEEFKDKVLERTELSMGGIS